MPELAFFLGKGGVGKSTVSAAYAVYSALQSPRRHVLLLSTDPAHSLADILQLKLGERPTPVPLPAKGHLSAWQLNPAKRFRAFLAKYKDELLATIEKGTIFTRQEIEPLLDATLPGMAEVSSLLAIDDVLGGAEFDSIVVDTAPFGHTLRLLSLPEHFSRFLDFVELASSRDAVLAAHFGGTAKPVAAFLGTWRKIVEAIRDALIGNAKLFLVTTPERFALNESLRCAQQLRDSPEHLEFSSIVLNRAVRAAAACAFCKKRAAATRSASSLLKKQFPSAHTHIGEDVGSPVLGASDLQRFAEHVFEKRALRLKIAPPKAPEPKLKSGSWPQLQQSLIMSVGKGGVGKTTIAAGLAWQIRKSKPNVAICSVDPAPSLDDIFQQPVGDSATSVLDDPGLMASELDAPSQFAQWVTTVRQQIDVALSRDGDGVGVDLSFERRLFSALLDVVPPGVDEVFAVFRILDLLSANSSGNDDKNNRRVVIDMAPTGHALELLRMPERMQVWSRLLLKTLSAHRRLALARDVAVQIAEMGQRVRELRQLLKDSARTQIWTVMLAEPLPDRETERLLHQLSDLDLPLGLMVVNRVLFREDVKNCDRCQRARRWQLATLARVGRRRGRDIYVMRNFPSEIVGRRGLQSLTRQIWCLG